MTHIGRRTDRKRDGDREAGVVLLSSKDSKASEEEEWKTCLKSIRIISVGSSR